MSASATQRGHSKKIELSANIQQIWKKMQASGICAPILIPLHMQLYKLSVFMICVLTEYLKY